MVLAALALLTLVPAGVGQEGEAIPWAHIQGIAIGDSWTFQASGQETGEIHNEVTDRGQFTSEHGATYDAFTFEISSVLEVAEAGTDITTTQQITATKHSRYSDYAAIELEGDAVLEGATTRHVLESYEPPHVETVFPFTTGYQWQSRAAMLLQVDGQDGGQGQAQVLATVDGPERVTVPAGTFDAWRLNITSSKDPEGWFVHWYAESACDLVKEERWNSEHELVTRLELTSFHCSRLSRVDPTYDRSWVTLIDRGIAGGPTGETPQGTNGADPETTTPLDWRVPVGTLAVIVLVGLALLMRGRLRPRSPAGTERRPPLPPSTP